jgi:hypothetical protein
VDSGTAHAQAALEAVDPGGIDSLSLAQAGADCWYGQEIAVAATVAGQPILGAECGWTIVPPAASAIWDAGGFVGESAPRWTPKTGHQ